VKSNFAGFSPVFSLFDKVGLRVPFVSPKTTPMCSSLYRMMSKVSPMTAEELNDWIMVRNEVQWNVQFICVCSRSVFRTFDFRELLRLYYPVVLLPHEKNVMQHLVSWWTASHYSLFRFSVIDKKTVVKRERDELFCCRMDLRRCTSRARRIASQSLSCYLSTALPSKPPPRFTSSFLAYNCLLLSAYKLNYRYWRQICLTVHYMHVKRVVTKDSDRKCYRKIMRI